jgi:serine protease Do
MRCRSARLSVRNIPGEQVTVRWSFRVVALTVPAMLASNALAASPTPALQRWVEEATYEVVVRKTDPDPLTYERPLPLDLLPYKMRNDAYWSIGTAFAIGPNSFVSAAHVIALPVGSQFGAPALRGADGRVHRIEKILKFSEDRDFAVFSVADPPRTRPLPVKTEHHLHQIVFAAGNALGQGVVIRDGLLTSETPEDLDGRWNWLRYSAAASPGSSGGPLLDNSGAVIGVITAKSPAENLNYALPIAAVQHSSADTASFDSRDVLHLLMLHDRDVTRLKGQFSLPRTYSDFAAAFRESLNRAFVEAVQHSLKLHEGEIFPRGNAAKALASPYRGFVPTFLFQDDDKVWQALDPEESGKTDLGEGGEVSTGLSQTITVFHVQRSDHSSTTAFYDDPKAFADLIVKGLKIYRPVGTDAIRVTSLGPVQLDERHTDGHGRIWQLRSWWLGFDGGYLVEFCLPTPDGYAGFSERVPAMLLDRAVVIGKLLTDYAVVSYSGTPTQWQAFLSRAGLRPGPFERDRLEFDVNKGLQFESGRMKMDIPGGVLHLSDRSALDVYLGYADKEGSLAWDVVGMTLREDIDKVTLIRILRQPKPGDGAGQELQQRWQRMSNHQGPYDTVARNLGSVQGFVISSAVGAPWNSGAGLDPNLNVLYEVLLQMEAPALPREVEDRLQDVTRGFQVLER